MIEKQEEFCPNWASPPGDTIADLIQERSWTQVQLAKRLGISKKHVNRLINGKVALTDDMAFRLATVLGSTEQFWLRREAQYRQQSARLIAKDRYRDWHDWLEEFPLDELKQAGILPKQRLSSASKTAFVEKLLMFFSIATPEQWKSNYVQKLAEIRRTQDFDSSIGALTAWLRQGEIQVESFKRDSNYDPQNVRYSSRKFKTAIHEIRKFTVCKPEEFQQKMQAHCLNAGVFLIIVPAIPKANISGAVRSTNRKCPSIQLSLSGQSNDRFWFSFFHEAAHVLLHAKEKEKIFLDDDNYSDSRNPLEVEANEFADKLLIPLRHRIELDELKTKHDTINFALKIGIHPGIVVGKLQKEGIIPDSHLNELKEQYKISIGNERFAEERLIKS